jgi:transposase
MDVVHARCAGMDISKRDAKVCVRIQGPGGRVSNEVRTFGSKTKDVFALRAHLQAAKVTCVVMEATGDYWKPFYYLLEDLDGVAVLLVNARQARNMPGRKTDVKDAVWLADLGAHRLLPGSFVPPPPIRRLRALTRQRVAIAREQAREIARMEKVLEDAGIKLSAEISDLTGVSGRRMLTAMIAGQRDPQVLADLGDFRLRASRQDLIDALTGRFTDHHAFLVREHLEAIDAAAARIARLEERIEAEIEPFRQAVDHLITIPGIKQATAQVIIAETGADMSRFSDPAHLCSWAGLAPGHHESAGKRKNTRTRPGDVYLHAALGTAVMSIVRSNNSRLAARYRRIAYRRGPLRANVAVQRTILTAVWHMLSNDLDYTDLGADFYQRIKPDRAIRNAVHTLKTHGYDVVLQPTAA